MFNIDIYQNRLGAEAARGAHNSEVIRSKRIVGIRFLPFILRAILKNGIKNSNELKIINSLE
jgi:hypothetical protein